MKTMLSSHRNLPQGRVSTQVFLVPVDFSAESSKALKSAAAIAGGKGADLKILHVVEPLQVIYDCGYGPVVREKPNQTLLKAARSRLKALARRHLGSALNWEACVRTGIPFEQIVAHAKDSRADLILMPTRGATALNKIPVGSTAERVVRYAGCPVLVLPKSSVAKRRR